MIYDYNDHYHDGDGYNVFIPTKRLKLGEQKGKGGYIYDTGYAKTDNGASDYYVDANSKGKNHCWSLNFTALIVILVKWQTCTAVILGDNGLINASTNQQLP